MSKTVVSLAGERWDALAYRLWGVTGPADRLREANSQLPVEIRYADVLPGGLVLIVPDLTEADARPEVEVPPWRK